MKQTITLNRPNWIGSEVGAVLKTITVTETTANYVIENNRKIIPSGTLIVTPQVSGLLYNDCDVTDGERVAQVMVRGSYIDSKLPTSVSGSKRLLANQGLFAIKYAETVIPSGDNGSSVSLTKFKAGQTIAGFRVNTEAASENELYDLCKNATEDKYVSVTGDKGVYTAFDSASDVGIFMAQGDGNGQLFAAIYITNDYSPEENRSFKKGWYTMTAEDLTPDNLTPATGVIDIIFNGDENVRGVVPDFEKYNGVLVGAIESTENGGGTTDSLIPFKVGDSQKVGDIIAFNTSVSDDTMLSFLQNLTYDEEGNHFLIMDNSTEISGVWLNAVTIQGAYALQLITNDKFYAWCSEDNSVLGFSKGWNNVPSNGEITITSVSSSNYYASVVSQTEGWNGILIGWKYKT